jgi:hypothetical protein
MKIDWSTVQLSLRPKDENEQRIATEFAELWRTTRHVGEELGWDVSPGSIVQLYLQFNEASEASEIFISPSKRDRFLFRVTPRPGKRQSILDALHAAAAALPHASGVAATTTRRTGNVTVDVVEVTSSWEAVIGEDVPDGPTVEKRLHAFVGPLLRAIPPA